jgi:hypothetical protein
VRKAATLPADFESISYQWHLNGVAIAGATGATLLVSNLSPDNAGNYACLISNSSGSTLSAPAVVTVTTTSNPGRLINLSILTELAANETMTMGTVLGGAGTRDTKPLLARAAGPSLTAFGLTAVLPSPTMMLNNTSASPAVPVARNTGWGGSPALSNVFAQFGAFPFKSNASLDSAIFQSNLAPGSYTVQVSDATNAGGTVIAELYDATSADAFTGTTPRLINVSVLKQIGTSGSITAGFVIGGTTAKTVLIRAIGPTLGLAPFNIPAVMPSPQLILVNTSSTPSSTVATNKGWGGDPQITQIGNRVGAFAVADSSSKDAMLLNTLAPGSYTVQVSSVSGTVGGTAIVEVYEVP